MKDISRVTLIVLDSVGAGELPDAADFDDVGSNTLGNMAKAAGGMNLPNMQKLGELLRSKKPKELMEKQ